MTDASIADHGSIVLLTPLSPIAEAWVKDNLPEDAPRFGFSIAIEHRYAADIIEGMMMDGLIVSPQ